MKTFVRAKKQEVKTQTKMTLPICTFNILYAVPLANICLVFVFFTL